MRLRRRQSVLQSRTAPLVRLIAGTAMEAMEVEQKGPPPLRRNSSNDPPASSQVLSQVPCSHARTSPLSAVPARIAQLGTARRGCRRQTAARRRTSSTPSRQMRKRRPRRSAAAPAIAPEICSQESPHVTSRHRQCCSGTNISVQQDRSQAPSHGPLRQPSRFQA